jgi:hypothetical protein
MHGQCLCGSIAFEVDGPFAKLYQCHCSLCRKQGGSSSNSALLVDAGKFRWLACSVPIGSYVMPTGFRSDFCSRCGSPTPNPLRNTSYFWVPAGLLDDEAPLMIGTHLFVASKAPWDNIAPEASQHEYWPGLGELIRSLQP